MCFDLHDGTATPTGTCLSSFVRVETQMRVYVPEAPRQREDDVYLTCLRDCYPALRGAHFPEEDREGSGGFSWFLLVFCLVGGAFLLKETEESSAGMERQGGKKKKKWACLAFLVLSVTSLSVAGMEACRVSRALSRPEERERLREARVCNFRVEIEERSSQTERSVVLLVVFGLVSVECVYVSKSCVALSAAD